MQDSPLMSGTSESRALSVVRAGMDLRQDDEGPDFWQDFINVCGNNDGMSELLGVPVDKIRSWPQRIREMKEKLEKQDAHNPAKRDETEMLPTGETGAVVMNADPNI